LLNQFAFQRLRVVIELKNLVVKTLVANISIVLKIYLLIAKISITLLHGATALFKVSFLKNVVFLIDQAWNEVP
jgi:hypothetical protein